MTEEIWKDIKGYEGYFMISNLGRVKSVERYVPQGNSLRHVDERIKRVHIGAYGYPSVTLCKDRKSISIPIHRLLARAFIPNPDNKPHIDHIDTDICNYALSNLRWVTAKENRNNPLTLKHCSENTYSKSALRKRIETRIKKPTKTSPRRVFQYSKSGEFIAEYESSREAQRITGIMASSIRSAYNGKRYSAGGYVWKQIKEDDVSYEKPTHPNAKAVLQYDREGNLIKEWPSLRAVCEVYGSAPSNLSKSIARQKFRGKYIWKFKE